MKKNFIIPGFKQKPTHKSFVWLKEFLNQKGFEVVLVPITWERRTMTNYVSEFENFYNKNKTQENYIVGFSYGAVITLMTAEKLKPQKIFLCSLSPDFKEDVKYMSSFIRRYIGKRRVADCLRRSGHDVAKTLTIPAVIFYGEKEGKQYPRLKKRCEETAHLAKNATLVVVKDSPHDISHHEYVQAIKKQF